MIRTRLTWSALVVLLLSSSAFCADVVVQGDDLTMTLDVENGLPTRMESEHGKGRTWLHGPASLEVKNMVTGTAASPRTLQRDQTGFSGPIEPLTLTMSHRWTALGQKAIQWHLKFDGDAKRVEHCVVIDLPVLKRSDRVFTPTQYGVIDVAKHPAFKSVEYAHYDFNGGVGHRSTQRPDSLREEIRCPERLTCRWTNSCVWCLQCKMMQIEPTSGRQ